jgi:hypothetical protein
MQCKLLQQTGADIPGSGGQRVEYRRKSAVCSFAIILPLFGFKFKQRLSSVFLKNIMNNKKRYNKG